MFLTVGSLEYSVGTEGHRLVVNVDPEIVRLARKLAPLAWNVQKSRYPAHITVVRKESPLLSAWGRHQGEYVEIRYDPEMRADAKYVWYRCWSDKLNTIREELGLPRDTPLTRPPDGDDCFHITIGRRQS